MFVVLIRYHILIAVPDLSEDIRALLDQYNAGKWSLQFAHPQVSNTRLSNPPQAHTSIDQIFDEAADADTHAEDLLWPITPAPLDEVY
jgi:hypothetical protein